MDTTLKLSRQDFLELADDDVVLLIESRFHELCELGCDPGAALVLAVHPEIRVDDAADLLARGCDAPTALRILL